MADAEKGDDDDEEGNHNKIKDDVKIEQNGIYDAQARRWLVDSVGFYIKNYFWQGKKFLIIKNIRYEKYGLMGLNGQFIVPITYDSIAIDHELGIGYLKNKNKYQIFSITNGKAVIHKTKYDFLADLSFKSRPHLTLDVPYFLAKRSNKWGIIDTAETIIKPFEFDYVYAKKNSQIECLMVKNGQAASFSLYSLPNDEPIYRYRNNGDRPENKLQSFELVDNPKRSFFINDTGKVILPPQYKLLETDNAEDYAFVEDVQKHKKVVFFEKGIVIDFPFAYKIKAADPESRLLLVKDTAELSFGVVSTDGKQILPCKNYGVAIGDIKTSTFFAKRDTPIMHYTFDKSGKREQEEVDQDTLTIEDSNWLMYDGNGKQLNDKPFNFPIDFIVGIGIGLQDGVFNLYNTDGEILMPFIKNDVSNTKNTEGVKMSSHTRDKNFTGFKNIRRDPNLGYYALFSTRGLTPLMQVTKGNGEIVVENGRYDGISKFYDQYALVSAGGKTCLIDSFGREIIAPQDLRTYSQHFWDFLNAFNVKERKKYYPDSTDAAFERYDGEMKQIDLPIALWQNVRADTTNPNNPKFNAFQRVALWNLMLEQVPVIKNVSDIKIPRVSLIATADFLQKRSYNSDNPYKIPYKIEASDSTIAFILQDNGAQDLNYATFYNFYRRNGRWENLKINELLQIQGEKRDRMNDLLIKKIKALKDVAIDCSNPAAFIEQAEKKWLVTRKGIDCYFQVEHRWEKSALVSFSWAELSPFLKLKIY